MLAQWIRCIWVLIFVIVLQISSALAAGNRGEFLLKENGDYFGHDLLTKKNVTLDQCKSTCLKNLGCLAFTYNKSAKFCFLKSDFDEIKFFEGAVAGRLVKPGLKSDIGAPPKLSFVPAFIHERAVKFRARIITKKKQVEGLGFNALSEGAKQRLLDGNIITASLYLTTALKIDPDHQQSWNALSEVANRHRSDNSTQTRFFRNTATLAALNGYLLSRTKQSRAQALVNLARGLEAQQRYRPALTAYQRSLGTCRNSRSAGCFS